MSPDHLTTQLKQRARELGFSLCGVCPAVAPAGLSRLDEWLSAGYAGQMYYIAGRRDAYDHPKHVLDGVRSILMLGMAYATADPKPITQSYGRVARYAWGDTDYHDVVRERLHQLADYLQKLNPGTTTRGIVDTAPLLEREFAQLAGLGWVGKNTLLLNTNAGSYFCLAALLTDVELAYDAPHVTDHCGTCRACLDACPTQAFPQPYVLDATRCVSYLTIEMHDAVPMELRSGMDNWVFGCDVCQEVCPWNRDVPRSAEPAFAPHPDMNPLELTTLFDMTEEDFRQRFRRTPVWRAHRRGLLRSAAIVLGNQRAASAVPALAKGLSDVEPAVRGACAWALGKMNTSDAHDYLIKRRLGERDATVLDEIGKALEQVFA